MNFSHLKRICLEKYKIESIYLNTFSGLEQNLNEINLSINKLSKIDSNLFFNLNKLALILYLVGIK